MTPKQSKEWFDRLPDDVRPGVEEMYQAFAARYRSSPQSVREEAQTLVNRFRAVHPEPVKAWYAAQEQDLSTRRMSGIWRFGLPPNVRSSMPFDTFWTAVDVWIDQNTRTPPEKPWRPSY